MTTNTFICNHILLVFLAMGCEQCPPLIETSQNFHIKYTIKPTTLLHNLYRVRKLSKGRLTKCLSSIFLTGFM